MNRKFIAVVVALFALSARSASAAIACTNLTASGSGAGSSKATASVAPTANNIVLVFINTSSTNDITSVTGASMTWVEVADITYDSGNRRETLYRGMSASPGSGALTLNAAGSQSAWAWSIFQCSGVLTTGSNGADAIVANASSMTAGSVTSGTTTSTGCSVTLSALSNVNNASVGHTHQSGSGSAVSVGSGYTAIGTFGNLLTGEWLAPGSTTVNFTWSSRVATYVCGAVELAADTSGVVSVNRGLLLGVK